MTAEPSLTGRRLGRFPIEQLLGAEGMGAVYRAFDTALSQVTHFDHQYVLRFDATPCGDALVVVPRHPSAATRC